MHGQNHLKFIWDFISLWKLTSYT